MARSRRPARRGGTRGRRGEEAVPEVAPLEFAEPERPARMGRARPSGGGGGGIGIGVVIPLATAIVAALCLIAGGFLVKMKADAGMDAVVDEVGVNTVLALTVPEPEWWEARHGLSMSLVTAFRKKYEERVAKIRSDPDASSQDIPLAKQEYEAALKKWDVKPDQMAEQRDAALSQENRVRLRKRLKDTPGSTVLWAGVGYPGGSFRPIQSTGPYPVLKPGPSRKIGNVVVQKVLADNLPARLYTARFESALGKQAEARAILSAVPAKRAGSALTGMVLLSSLIGLVVVGLVAFLLCMGPAKALKRLARDADDLAHGNLDARISTRGPSEIARIARSLDRAVKTFRSLEEQAAAQPVAAPVAAETVDSARLLPAEPPAVEGYEIASVHKPSPLGATDFFDYVTVDADHLGVVIADMPHGGAHGVFVATTFRALLRAYAPGEHSPAAVLSRINRVMAGELRRGDHISAMYTVLDLSKGILAVASAGHLPLIFWKLTKRGSALLNPEGIAIGLDKGPVFEKTVVDKRIKLEKGDRFVLHTDGAVAARNALDEEFGEQRFYYVVNREAPKNSDAFVNFVANDIDLFHEGAPQQDDITIVTVRKLSD